MIQPYKSANTYAMENYTMQIRSSANPFPCRVRVRKPVGFLAGLSFVRRSQQSPETVRCGDPISDDESALCRSCHSELTNQLTGIEEGIPLAGSPEDLQASAEIQEGRSRLGCKAVAAALIVTAGAVVTGLIIYGASAKSNLSRCMNTTGNCTVVENVPLSSCVQITGNCEVKNDCSMPIYFTTNNNLNGTEVLAGSSSAKHCALPTNSSYCRLPEDGYLCSTGFRVSSHDDMRNEIKLPNKYNIRENSHLTDKPARQGINKIQLNVANLRSDASNATILQCDQPNIKDGEICVQSKFTILSMEESIIDFNLKNDHGTMRAFYTDEAENPIEKSSTSKQTFQGFDFASKSVLSSEPSPDLNKDEILTYKHTILNFYGAETLDQSTESDDGKAYSGILTKKIEISVAERNMGMIGLGRKYQLAVGFQEKGSYDSGLSREISAPYRSVRFSVPAYKTGMKVSITQTEKDKEIVSKNVQEISASTLNRFVKEDKVCFKIEKRSDKPTFLSDYDDCV